MERGRREWRRRKGKTHRRKAKGPINSFLGGHVTTQEKHREGIGSLPVHAWPPGLCHSGSVRPGERKTNRTLSPHEFGFKLVVSRCRPPPRTNSSENYTHIRPERGGERGRGGLESDQCSPGSRGLRGCWLCLCGVRGSCASSSCHTWSPNYVASRGLNTHTHTIELEWPGPPAPAPWAK